MNQYEMKQIAYKSTLKSRALQVLVYLIDRSNKEGTCYPAISTMSQELHISVSTVKRALKELTVSGFVKKESRFREKNNGQTSNLYILCFAGISKSKELNEETKKKVHIRKENRNKPHTMEDALTSISIFPNNLVSIFIYSHASITFYKKSNNFFCTTIDAAASDAS